MNDIRQPARAFPWRKVGVIADSHGRERSIVDGIDFLKRRGCDAIFHLGDICDSFLPDTVERCVEHLVQNGVRAIKGNNDHMLVANNRGFAQTRVSLSALDYLERLPLVEEYREVLFAHSLPYARQLGLACMVQKMGASAAGTFIRGFRDTILFRGHSHSPEITWLRDRGMVTENLTPGSAVDLAGKIPCIITCGALMDGLCMIWEPGDQKLALLSFSGGTGMPRNRASG